MESDYNNIFVNNVDSSSLESSIQQLLERNSTTYKALVSTDEKGWLDVTKDSGGRISLAKHTRVLYKGYNASKTREHFTIVDWPFQNVKASVSAISKTQSRFKDFNYSSGALLVFDKAKKTLKYGSSGVVVTSTDSRNPMPSGTYNIWLPDYYHKYGDPYLGISKYATIWFRVGKESSERYIHVGNISEGCVTVGMGATDSDKKKWDKIVDYLVRNRVGAKYAGKIKVI